MNELIPVSFRPGHDTEKVFQTLDQWDKGRKLQFTGLEDYSNVEVHFSFTPTHGKAVVVESEILEDSIIAQIPQHFLENEGAKGTTYSIYAFVYYDDGPTADTLKRAELIVKTRPKPEDYVYTEEELKTWESLENRIENLEKNGGGASVEQITEIVEGELTKAKESGEFNGPPGVSGVYVGSGEMPEGYNVQIDPDGEVPELVTKKNLKKLETDPTVPEWAKQPTKPSYTADEVGAVASPPTAEVGQTIVVEEVDENGKPIKWRCADALKQATETDLGGIKAKAKTEETLEVAVDAENGKLYAPNAYGNELELLFDYTVTAEDVELYKITFTKDVYPQLAKIKNGLLVHAGTTSSTNRVYTQVFINNVTVCGWEQGAWATAATGCFFRNGYALKQSSQHGNRYVALALGASGEFFFDNGDVGIKSTKKLSDIPDFPNINSIALGSWDKGFLPEGAHLRFYAF